VPKLLSLHALAKELKNIRSLRKRIVFTNGCFDILHAGHVRYLEEAGSLGDILIIGLNSDKSVHLIKGDKRPVIVQDQRAEVLAGLSAVDFIVLFDEPDPLNIIKTIKPDILVKGGGLAGGGDRRRGFCKSSGWYGKKHSDCSGYIDIRDYQ